jgi:hypothetical protein
MLLVVLVKIEAYIFSCHSPFSVKDNMRSQTVIRKFSSAWLSQVLARDSEKRFNERWGRVCVEDRLFAAFNVAAKELATALFLPFSSRK